MLMWIGSAVSTVAFAADKPSAPTPEAFWRSVPLVTDGKIDKAWSHLGWGGFVVEDGALRTNPDERGMGLLVYTKEPLGDCRIRVVYRTKDARSNSGVYIRMSEEILKRLDDKAPAVKRDEKGKLSKEEIQKLMDASEQEKGAWWPVHHGFEVQICDTGDALHRTGAIYSLAKAAELPKADPGAWRTMIITLKGEQVTVEIDGKQISKFDASKEMPATRKWTEPKHDARRPTSGYIGLQSHDPGDIAWFKEISVQALK
jgi:hypothetical protein